MRSWGWRCPICDAGSRKPLERWRARHNGRWHIIETHGRFDVEPVVFLSEGVQKMKIMHHSMTSLM